MKTKIIFKIISIIIILIIMPVSATSTVASSNDIYNGIDVSNWQGYIDYLGVKQSGIEIVYIKSSQGDNVIDPYFKINYTNAKSNGLKIGFYHFLTARSDEEAVSQAEFFSSVISNTAPDCKLAMDFEQFGDLNIDEINSISEVFLEKVKELTKMEVIIYSDEYNAKNVFNTELTKKYPLWIAEYGVEVPSITNWKYWEGFQYSDLGIIKGINGKVDLDKFSSEIFLSSTNQIEKNGDENNYNCDITYKVKKGDTLSYIASEYNTTVYDLLKLNKIENPNLIFIGEKIIVPINRNYNDEKLQEPKHIIYTVKKGDTLNELALRFNTTVSSIAKLNEIKNINLIYIGEKLKIENY